jgi:hypothetical protein
MPTEEAVIATPTETPAATEAPAAAVETPAAAPVAAQPAAAATPAVARDPEQALRDAVGKQMDKVPGFEVTKKPEGAEVKTAEQLAAEKAEADKKTAEAAAANQTPEQKAAAEKAAADKAAADKAAADKTAADANPLDKLGPLPVETIAKAITENPELAAALEKAGIDSELLYETSRRAALTDQFTEIFPTPDAAKFAGENAQHFYDIEEGFPKIQSVEDFDKFLTGTMLPLSVLYDPKTGEPMMQPDGKGYQTDGSIGRFMNAAAQFETIGSVSAIDRLIGEYSKLQSEEGKEMLAEAQRIREAVVLAQNFRDSGYRLPGTKQQTTERSPADQALFEKLQKENAEAAKVKTDAQQQAREAYQSTVLSEAGTIASAFVVETLNRTSLTDTEKKLIAKEVQTEAWDALGKNRHFQMQKEHLYSLGDSPENKAALVALAKNTFETTAFKIMRAKVEEYGGKQISRQEGKLKKIDTQITNDRMNQGAGTTPGAKAAAVLTPAQVRTQALANLKAKGNTSPDDGEILAETMAIRGLGQRSA